MQKNKEQQSNKGTTGTFHKERSWDRETKLSYYIKVSLCCALEIYFYPTRGRRADRRPDPRAGSSKVCPYLLDDRHYLTVAGVGGREMGEKSDLEMLGGSLVT